MKGKALSRVDWTKLRQGMDADGVDVLLAASIENFFYISDTYLMSHITLPDRLGVAVVPREGEPAVLVCECEALQTRQDSWIEKVHTYVEHQETPMHALAALLEELGLGQARLGIEKKFLAADYAEELADWLPDATIVAADHIFDHARAIKASDEVDTLRDAAVATEQAIRAAFEAARPGETEKKVSDDIAAGLTWAGATSPWLVLGSGSRTAINHPYAGAKKLEKGEIMRVDIGGVFNGYQSDVARTAVIGTPSPEQDTFYKRLHEVLLETIAAVRPGVRAGDLHRTAARALEKRGLPYSFQAVGHSLGLGLHEFPILRAGVEAEIEPGMVLAIEPAARDSQGFLYHVEDTLLVTDDGALVFTDVMRKDTLFVIDG